MRKALLIAWAGLAACSSSSKAAVDPPAEPPVAEAPAAPPAEESCERNTVPLTLTFEKESVFRQLIPVTTEAGDGWFAIDTGSGQTFVYGADDRAPTHEVTIGCERLRVIRRSFEDEPFAGKPILGVLGADFFLSRPTDADFPGRKIVRYLQGEPSVEAISLTVPLVDLEGHMGLETVVDGEPRLLMLDTGSAGVLLAPMAGRPDDEAMLIQDASGEVIDAFTGPSTLTIGAETRTVPGIRVPSWPYFESYQKDLDPELAGLIGPSGYGFRRIIVHASAKTLTFGPLVPVPKE